jgi:hypothetical protein
MRRVIRIACPAAWWVVLSAMPAVAGQAVPPLAAPQVPPSSPPAAGVPAAPPEATPASPAAPQTGPTVPQAVEFPSGAGAILAAVKPDKTTDFEALLAMFAEALAKGGDATGAARLGGWKVYKAAEPVPGGPGVLYLIVIDPATGDYSWQSLVNAIYEAFPDRQREIYEKATSVHAGPMSKLTLTRVGGSP